MTIYYLCVKTHEKTGLKYLCQTRRKNPNKYLGSGLYWKRHLQKHGANITTEIIKECTSKEELSKWGLYYSELWDIVNDPSWANLIPEFGSGGRTTFGDNNPMKSLEVRNKVSGLNHYTKHKDYDKSKHHSLGKIHTGKNNPRFNANVYKFKNTSTNEVVVMTQYDFVSTYNLDQGNINKLVSGKCKMRYGWVIEN